MLLASNTRYTTAMVIKHSWNRKSRKPVWALIHTQPSTAQRNWIRLEVF